MPQNVIDLLNLFLRWAHVVAGVIWIGHLYFFNWVNAHFAKALDGPTKQIVVPQLMPRALYWFRWGAAWTWITGLLLGGLVYYHGRIVFEDPTAPGNNPWLWLAIVIVIVIIGFLIYNFVMKTIKNVVVASTICLILFAGAYLFLEYVGKFGGRSLYIHMGAIFGTMMAANVWMVIWPAQKRIIAAVKSGSPLPPDHPDVVQAGLRSRHNTYMSVPLVFSMVSNHYPTMFSNPMRDACLAGVIALGFLAVWMLYKKSGKVTGM